MAEAPTPKPQWATLFVIGGLLAVLGATAVFVGPSANKCAELSGNFGACLREDMAARGIIPADGADDNSVEVAKAEPAESATETQSAKSEQELSPAPDAVPAAEKPGAETTSTDAQPETEPRGLWFDSRVEPDGSTIVAGSGAPSGAEVQVLVNGELLGQTTAQSNGDWVVLPETPLPTGGVEITARTADGATAATTSQIVIVNEDRSSEPLVIASTPGEADEVIQGLVASSNAEPSVGPAPQLDVAEVEAPAKTSTEPDQKPETQAVPPADAEMAVDTEQAMVNEKSEAAPTVESKPIEATETAAEAKPESVVQDEESPQPAPSTEAQIASLTPPTIDAIEIDGNRNFFAGGGQEGAIVRLYVDDEFVSDTIVRGGRWLVETNEQLLTEPSQRVRADMLQTGSATVVARAEVNFDIAPVEPTVEVAEAAPNTGNTADETAPAIDASAAINAAASENTSTQLANPPELPSAQQPTEPDTTTATAQSEPEPEKEAKPEEIVVAEAPPQSPPEMSEASDPESAINAAASDNAANQLAAPPTLPAQAPEALVEREPVERKIETTKAENIAPADREIETAKATPPAPVVASNTAQEVRVPTEKPMSKEAATEKAPVLEKPTMQAESKSVSEEKQADVTTPSQQVREASSTETPELNTTAAVASEAQQPAREERAPQPDPKETAMVKDLPSEAKRDTVKAQSPTVTTQLETKPETIAKPEIPTLVARPTADGRFVSGQAIIRRGDNLWTIARRVYGQGIRYTTIYQANQGQIRDPHWIYPGQVFDLPDEDR